MKRITVVIFLFLSIFVVSTAVSFDVARDAEGYYLWRAPGGNPRNPDGVKSRMSYCQWMLSQSGINDLLRCGLPKPILQKALFLVNHKIYGQENKHLFSTGEWGFIQERTILSGKKYHQITYANGKIIPRVKAMFDGDVFTLTLVDQSDVVWEIDTFIICANSGRSVITPYFPKPSSERPQPSPKAMMKYYYPDEVFIPAYNRAEEKSVKVGGILNSGIGRILAAWIRRPNRINITASPIAHGGAGNAHADGGVGGNGYGYGGSATGGSVGPISQQQQQDLEEGDNNNTVIIDDSDIINNTNINQN